MRSNLPSVHSALRWFRVYSARYPQAWSAIEAIRRRDWSLWPAWCYIPLRMVYDVLGRGRDDLPGVWLDIPSLGSAPARWAFAEYTEGPKRLDMDAVIVQALAAWRPGKGIYRYDETLRQALVNTPITDTIPSDVLHHLPEWCVYLDHPLPGKTFDEWGELVGAWIHLSAPIPAGKQQLRFLLDFSTHLCQVGVDLGGSISDGLRSHLSSDWFVAKPFIPVLSSLLSLVLYLCSDTPDIRDVLARGRRPIRTGGGEPIASGPQTWQVGIRVGAALRRAHETQGDTVHPHGSPRSHARIAHWHLYWTGPGKRVPVLRWLHLIEVKRDPGSPEKLPSVMRGVEKSWKKAPDEPV